MAGESMTGQKALNDTFLNAPQEAFLRLAEMGHMDPGSKISDMTEAAEYNLIRRIFEEANIKIRFKVELVQYQTQEGATDE